MEAREIKSCRCNASANPKYYKKLTIQFAVELKSGTPGPPINQCTVTWEVHGRVAQSLSFEDRQTREFESDWRQSSCLQSLSLSLCLCEKRIVLLLLRNLNEIKVQSFNMPGSEY